MSEIRAIAAVVGGRVQGVGFRYSTQGVASKLGLSGWVRNQPDGTVAVQAQGPDDAVTRFCGFLEEGPPAARVTQLEIVDVDPDANVRGFNVRF